MVHRAARGFVRGPKIPEGKTCYVYCLASADGDLVKVGSSINPDKRTAEHIRSVRWFWEREFVDVGRIIGDRQLECDIQSEIGGHGLPRANGGISPEMFPWSRHLVTVLTDYGFELPEWFVRGSGKSTLQILEGVAEFADKHFAFRGGLAAIDWKFKPELAEVGVG